jgi:Na+-transporting NADH:ubiquinone oxidoreductase subunit NqrD
VAALAARLIAASGRSLAGVFVLIAPGLAILSPCAFFIYAMTTWAIRGFAP